MIKRLFFLLLVALDIQPGQRCKINSRMHFGEPLPVIIRNRQLLEPTDDFGNVELGYGDTLLLSCEGTGFIHHPNAIREVTTASITCDNGEDFYADWLNAPAPFSMFRCSESPNHSTRKTDRICYGGNTVIEVGYRIENEFYPAFESCFDEVRRTVLYSKYTQKPYNAHFQQRVNRPYFHDNDNNYGYIPVNTLFSPRGLKMAVQQAVGGMVDTYVTASQSLSRGHLAAKTDFVFAFGERATFHYVNCAPQWTGFNGGNWNTLEVDLRNHIHEQRHNTIIYTGTFGVMQLLNQFGRQTEIYLHIDENNNPTIPVPLYYYKVVYEPSTMKGIAFIGINNPYFTEEKAQEMYFCQDVCRGDSRFSWLSWHPRNRDEGYAFCCTVDDFRQTVPHLPEFEVQSLLT